MAVKNARFLNVPQWGVLRLLIEASIKNPQWGNPATFFNANRFEVIQTLQKELSIESWLDCHSIASVANGKCFKAEKLKLNKIVEWDRLNKMSEWGWLRIVGWGSSVIECLYEWGCTNENVRKCLRSLNEDRLNKMSEWGLNGIASIRSNEMSGERCWPMFSRNDVIGNMSLDRT